MRASHRLKYWRAVRHAAVCLAIVLVAAACHADDAQKHFDAGVKLYREHKPDDALTEFNQALKGAPKDPNILRWIGFIELERQDYQAAREPLERALELDPNSVVAHLNLGNVYDGLKLLPKALDEFRKATKLKPDSADAYYDMGLIHSRMGHWREAVDALRTAAKLDTAAAKATTGGREDPFIHDALGYALMNDNDSRGAVGAYQRAVALAPDNPEFNYHLGLAWRRVSDEKKAPQQTPLASARRALKAAVDRSPGNYEFVELYGEVLFDLNRNAEAAEQFARAAEIDKSQYNPVYNMAAAYSRLGKYPEAEKGYARALTLVKPTDDAALRRNALNGLTTSLIKQKKYDEAISNLKTFTTDYPSDAVGWVNLAAAYRYKGDDAGQVEALKGAIANGAKYPNLAQLHAALGALLYKRDDSNGALEHYSMANRLQPDNAEILNGLALSEEKLGHFDDAIKDFQAATRVGPRFADAYNNLGVAYEGRYRATKDKADLDHALAAYDQALAVDPKHALALKNRERFDKVKRP